MVVNSFIDASNGIPVITKLNGPVAIHNRNNTHLAEWFFLSIALGIMLKIGLGRQTFGMHCWSGGGEERNAKSELLGRRLHFLLLQGSSISPQ